MELMQIAAIVEENAVSAKWSPSNWGIPFVVCLQADAGLLVQVLGLGMLLATSFVAPAYAEKLADPKKTGGEVVKAPSSAPTTEANATGPKPVAQPKDGQDLVRFTGTL